MVEFFPLLSQVTNLRAVGVGQAIEVRADEKFYSHGTIARVDEQHGIVWVRTKYESCQIFNDRDFTFWRYII
jgi:hypothetical protein